MVPIESPWAISYLTSFESNIVSLTVTESLQVGPFFETQCSCHSVELYVNVVQNISRAKYTNSPSHLAAVLQCLDLEPSAELMK